MQPSRSLSSVLLPLFVGGPRRRLQDVIAAIAATGIYYKHRRRLNRITQLAVNAPYELLQLADFLTLVVRPTSTTARDAAVSDGMMFPLECPLCGCGNVAGSKFCMHCGSPVDLMACPRCDAINARDSGYCYQCHASLAGRTSAERDAPAVNPVAGAAVPTPAHAETIFEAPVASLPRDEPAAPGEERVAAPELATAVATARRSRAGPLTIVLLVVLTATGAAAVYAYYHEDTIGHFVQATFERYVRPVDTSSSPTPVKADATDVGNSKLVPPVAAERPEPLDHATSPAAEPVTQAAALAGAEETQVAAPASSAVNASVGAPQEQSGNLAPVPRPPTAEASDAPPSAVGAAAEPAVTAVRAGKSPSTSPRVDASATRSPSKLTSPSTRVGTSRGTSTSQAQTARRVMSTRGQVAPDVRRPATPSRACTPEVAALGFCTAPTGATR